MLGKLDFYMLNPFCSTNVYGLATLNTPKEKILILGLVGIPLAAMNADKWLSKEGPAC